MCLTDGSPEIIALKNNVIYCHCHWCFKGKIITKTRLYNSDPLKPHVYIVKLVFTEVYIIFLISAQIIKTQIVGTL